MELRFGTAPHTGMLGEESFYALSGGAKIADVISVVTVLPYPAVGSSRAYKVRRGRQANSHSPMSLLHLMGISGYIHLNSD